MTPRKGPDARTRTDLCRALPRALPRALVSAATLLELASACSVAAPAAGEPAIRPSEALGSQLRESADVSVDDDEATSIPLEGDDAQQDCSTSASAEDEPCDSCDTKAYEHCESYESCASLGPNANCTAYTQARESTFCAPYCTSDEDCPTLPGFAAACNWAFCALLCEQGACPSGMECVRDVPFIDGQARERGLRDVCVIAP